MAVRECTCCHCCYLYAYDGPCWSSGHGLNPYPMGEGLMADCDREVVVNASEYNDCGYYAYLEFTIQVTGGPCPMELCCLALDEDTSCTLNFWPQYIPSPWVCDEGDRGLACSDRETGALVGEQAFSGYGGPFESYDDAAADLQAAKDAFGSYYESIYTRCNSCGAPGLYCACYYDVEWDGASVAFSYENIYEIDGYYLWEASGDVYATGGATCDTCGCCSHWDTDWCTDYVMPTIDSWNPGSQVINCDNGTYAWAPPCTMYLITEGELAPYLADCSNEYAGCFIRVTYKGMGVLDPFIPDPCEDPVTYSRMCECCDQHLWHCIRKDVYEFDNCTGAVESSETLCSRRYHVGCNGGAEFVEVLSGPYASFEDCDAECAD